MFQFIDEQKKCNNVSIDEELQIFRGNPLIRCNPLDI